MINKLLIANRGEIAVRIIRACAEMGIRSMEGGVRSVAVYTDADHCALHVKKADEAYSIGPDPVAGYLNAHRIVNLAVETGCTAIHPGYGFLSENPQLAEVCAKRRIRFIGPSAQVIRRMGNKTEARRAMIEAGIPVIPGSEGNLRNLDNALEQAEEIGYPVMLKATTGGGGRGIRRCNNADDLRKGYDRVISEVTKAFGNADIFLEKCVVNPVHIEVQILADSHGNVIHLFERDCSIQRRNQKLIEIAPSPQLSSDQQAMVGALGVKAAKAVGYENAGTVEFLLDAEGNFYFMEMNTRLQVEHTVSEEITGIDIVKEQIRIASGHKLRYRQEDVKARGYAMQFRINAEDPKNGFLPSFGRITRYYCPGGPGIRTDSAIYAGYEIPPYFDSMCAKLTVWADTWDELLQRGYRALKDIGVDGVKTTIPYYEEILKSSGFRSARFDTSFVENHPDLTEFSTKPHRHDIAAALAAVVIAHAGL
ncbi:MAG: acetyl-CoA carboxylase biotin carboxylase subunit [Gammaproteobacteria bacterium]|nr:acetyl-CoA carboxylase biotin carboxylase subunit [Gammaproteobacteria bacterium]